MQENRHFHMLLQKCKLANLLKGQVGNIHQKVNAYNIWPRNSASRSTSYWVHTHIYMNVCMCMGFPGSSAGKESTCNAGDPSSIPGSGRSTGKGIDYPLQYSWASLVTQTVKNLLAMQETWVRSLGWEDPLEKGKPTHSSILAWRIPWIIGVVKSQTRLSNLHFHFSHICI